MKALVIGGGSIGRRHLENLRKLGVEQLGVVETDAARRAALTAAWPLEGFAAISAGLDWNPDFAIVATPTHLHADQTLDVIRLGLDVFVEKPLCHAPADLDELCSWIARRSPVSMVGCNLRFHPGPAKVKELLELRKIGRLLCARLYCGSYLPGWRPGSDYRNNYAASHGTGGGCILDCIHEIDLARWFMGEVREVFCAAGHISSLEIATEDVAALVFRHHGGALSEIHLDYVQRTYERGCQIIGEEGSIFWDVTSRQVRWYEAATRQWSTFTEPADWQLNQMYLDEMKHFLDCVHSRRPTVLPIPEAVAVMQIAFAAKTSAREGKLISTAREVLA